MTTGTGIVGATTTRGKIMQALEQKRLLEEKIKKDEEKQKNRPMSVQNGRGNHHSPRKIPSTDDT